MFLLSSSPFCWISLVISLESFCWWQVFLYIRQSWFPFYSWKIFSPDTGFWVNSSCPSVFAGTGPRTHGYQIHRCPVSVTVRIHRFHICGFNQLWILVWLNIPMRNPQTQKADCTFFSKPGKHCATSFRIPRFLIKKSSGCFLLLLWYFLSLCFQLFFLCL